MIFFSIALLLLTANLAFGELSEARKQELAEKLTADGRLDIHEYPVEEKQWIEEWILNVAKRKPGTREDTYDRQLLQIGHRPTIEKYGRKIISLGGHANSTDSFQPRLIKYYEAELSVEEPAWMMQGEDTTGWRPSVSAAGGMLHLLYTSRELPAEVRVWARDLYDQLNLLGSDKPKARKGLAAC